MPSAGDAAAPRQQFIRDGFLRIDRAFAPELAAEARAILWRDSGCVADDPATWTRPVVRLGYYLDGPFVEAMNTSALHHIFDQLVGAGRWLEVARVGTFPIRFPSGDDPGDTGWHVDMSFDYHEPDFMDWRCNIHSRGRALLLIALFSDVGADDAPTKLRVGSHRDVARRLAPAGAAGLTLRQLAEGGFAGSAGRPEALATGPAGTVFACHPFLVHAGQRHRGQTPRFMAQPPLLPRGTAAFGEASDRSAVGEAIRAALADAE